MPSTAIRLAKVKQGPRPGDRNLQAPPQPRSSLAASHWLNTTQRPSQGNESTTLTAAWLPTAPEWGRGAHVGQPCHRPVVGSRGATAATQQRLEPAPAYAFSTPVHSLPWRLRFVDRMPAALPGGTGSGSSPVGLCSHRPVWGQRSPVLPAHDTLSSVRPLLFITFLYRFYTEELCPGNYIRVALFIWRGW